MAQIGQVESGANYIRCSLGEHNMTPRVTSIDGAQDIRTIICDSILVRGNSANLGSRCGRWEGFEWLLGGEVGVWTSTRDEARVSVLWRRGRTAG